MLRIAHIHWAFPPTTGGVESHLFDLARIQAKAGHEVTVITGEPEPTRTGEYEVITTGLLQLETIRDAPVDSRYPEALRRFLSAVISERQVGVIHGHDLHHFTPEPALVLNDLRAQFGFRLHHSFHETWPDVLADQPVYRTWDGNYAVSTFVQRGCALRIGFKPLLFPLAVDTDVFRTKHHPFRNPTEEPVILHPARLLPWKGVHVSVRMLGQLKRRGLRPRLVLTDTQRIADWNRELAGYRAEIRALIDELDLADQVEFVHPQFAEMPACYERADIVLYPTVAEEPFGLVPLEAMSSERPIVASYSGGIAETVLDDVTGYTTPPGDVDTLTDRVETLLRNPSRAREMGRAGRLHVLNMFDIRRYAETLSRYYAGTA